MGVSDEELVARARAGDVGAFDELVARHQERVYALAYRVLGDAEDAADIQQESFVRAWTSLSRFRGDAAFSTWLHRITLNLCLTRKKRKPAASAEILDEEHGYPGGLEDHGCRDALVDALAVRQILSEIPARHRSLLVLREIEGRSVAEIAEMLGGSEGAVRKHLWRARKLFRARAERVFREDEK